MVAHTHDHADMLCTESCGLRVSNADTCRKSEHFTSCEHTHKSSCGCVIIQTPAAIFVPVHNVAAATRSSLLR